MTYSELLHERGKISDAITTLKMVQKSELLAYGAKEKAAMEYLLNELKELDRTIVITFPEKIINL